MADEDHDPPPGTSDLKRGKITDRFAESFSKTIEALSKYDSFSLVLFLLIVLTTVVTGQLTNEFLAFLVLVGGLVFYQLVSRKGTRRKELELEERRLKLAEAEKSPQLNLPDLNDRQDRR